MSILDGLSSPLEMANRWKGFGDYLCITDHGMMAAIPQQIKACEPTHDKDDPNRNKRLIPLFGIEFYCNPLQIEYSSDKELQYYIKSLPPDKLKIMRQRGYHLLAIAFNNIGYKNLVKLSSIAWTKGFYYRPRVNHEQLRKYKEGIIFTSCCYASEVGRAFDSGGEEAGFAMIEKYLEMFGENFYLEIMLLDFAKQKPYNIFIIKAHQKYDIPIIITNDCLVKDTMVLTNKGEIPIKELNVGDFVYTHKCRFREVEVIVKRRVKHVYKVSSIDGKYWFKATANHKIRIVYEKDNVWLFDWKKVKDLTQQDYLLVNEDNYQVDFGDCSGVLVGKIEKEEYNDFVYDLQVNEDHSFVANGVQVSNCHYCYPEDSKYQRLMLMAQTDTTIQEIKKKMEEDGMQDFFELQDSNLWMKSEEELNEKWANDYSDVIDYEIFKKAKLNTVEICRKARGVELDRSLKLPNIPDADEKLMELMLIGAKKKSFLNNRVYTDRLKEEYELIKRKGFSSYFLIQKQMIDEAKRISPKLLGWGDGSEAVGVARGSSAGSLICYCLGITNLDPIRHGLLFSRFLNEARGGKSMKIRFKNIDPLLPEDLKL